MGHLTISHGVFFSDSGIGGHFSRDTTMKLGRNYHQLMENLLIVSIFN